MRRWLLAALFAWFGAGAAGVGLFRAGWRAEALEAFSRAARRDSSPSVRYDLGTALLATRQYAAARARLGAVADQGATTTGRELAFRAAFNVGNADLERAFPMPGSTPARRAMLLRAIERYEQALRLQPADIDAKWNLELAQRLLARSAAAFAGGSGGAGQADDAAALPAAPLPRGTEQVLAAARQAEARAAGAARGRAAAPPVAGVRDW